MPRTIKIWSKTAPIVAVMLLVVIASCNKNPTPPPTEPIISLSTSQLSFFGAAGGGNPSRQAVLVSNAGVDSLRFVATHLRSWLDLAVVEAPVLDTLFVSAYISGFPAGAYYDTITITSDNAQNSPQLIYVTATVQADVMVVPPVLVFETLVGGPNPELQDLTITSTGASGISFTGSKGQSWLTLSPTSGTTPDTISVGINNAGLASGAYRDTVVLTTGSPVTPIVKIPVALTARSWASNSTSPSYDLRGIAMIDNTTAHLAGFIGNTSAHTGVILRTTDGGQSWEPRLFITFAELGSIDFVDANHGWAVGRIRDSGLILATSDGGDTWNKVPVNKNSSDSVSFWRVKFANRQFGWICGSKGTLLHTDDSGRTWEPQTVPVNFSLADIDIKSPTNAWVVGNHGTILHTTDGATWDQQAAPLTNDLWTIMMIDESQGWIGGTAGTMYHTSDGGANWQSRPSGLTVSLHDVYFSDIATGWAVGDSGTILRYQSATDSWWRQNSGTVRTLFAASFHSSGYGVAVGELGTILITYNGGI